MWLTLLVTLFHVVGALSAIDAVVRVRTSQGAIAWVISLVVFPYLAVPAYWVLGRTRFHGYVEARADLEARLAPMLASARDALAPFVVEETRLASIYRGLARLARMPATTGNQATLLVDGDATFRSILEGIGAARSYVLVEFYIIHDDGLGRRLRDALLSKVREGVRCYVLYDELGSDLPKRYLRELREGGVHVSEFGTTRGRRNRFQLNFRNHRKIVVVDGRAAWIGGHNVGDEYLGLDPKVGPWRDTHARVVGPAALGAQVVFCADWYWATSEMLETSWSPEPAPDGDTPVLVFPSEPSSHFQEAGLLYLQAVLAARRRLWIASPYFVPDEGVVAALQIAALRGVDVRVLVPAKSDNLLVDLAAQSFFAELQASGVRIFLHQPGFMHQKVMLVDDDHASVGTANFDNRSFRLNFEVTLLVQDAGFAGEVEGMLERDLGNARECPPGEVAAWPFTRVLATRLARLTAPVL